MSKLKLLSLTFVLFFIPLSLRAELPKSLEEEFKLFQAEDITVTASKKKEKVREAPATVSVLTRDEIARLPGLNLIDVLRYVPGVEVYWAYESFPIVGMRGFTDESNNQVLLLIDGREVNNEVFGAPMWSLLPVSLEDIERIEVVRGPGSTLYGPNAFSGVINLITKNSSDKKHHGWVSTINAGPYFFTRNNLGYTGPLLGKAILTLNGHIDYSADAVYSSKRDLLSGGGRFMLTIHPMEKVKLNFSIGGSGGKFIYIFPFSPAFTTGKHTFARFSGGGYGAFIQVFWNYYSTDLDVFKAPESSNTTQFSLGVNMLDVEGRYTISAGKVFNLTFGVEFRSNLYNGENIESSLNENRYGLYVQGEFVPLNGLKLSLGLRFDDSLYLKERWQDTLSPRLAVIYTAGNHTFRLSGGRAFRRPSFMEYGVQVVGWTGELPAGRETLLQFNEVINNVELAYMGKILNRIKPQVALFYNYFQNAIYFDFTTDEFRYSNLSNNFDAVGAEISLDVLALKMLSFVVNYAFQYIRARTDVITAKNDILFKKGEQITTSPKHKLNAGVHFTPVSHLNFDLFLTFYSKRTYPHYTVLDPSGNKQSNTGYETAGPNYILNLKASYRFVKGFEVGVVVRNAFGKLFNEDDSRAKMYPSLKPARTQRGDTMYFGGEPMPTWVGGYLKLDL